MHETFLGFDLIDELMLYIQFNFPLNCFMLLGIIDPNVNGWAYILNCTSFSIVPVIEIQWLSMTIHVLFSSLHPPYQTNDSENMDN